MPDDIAAVNDDPIAELPPERKDLVGGNALPFGVMMRRGNRVAVAVRRLDDEIAVKAFDAPAPFFSRWRIARWPGIRALVALRASTATGRRAFDVMTRLMEPAGDEDGGRQISTRTAVLAAAAGAVVGFILQFVIFRLGPLVLAKEAGLTGASFILAEAGLRLAMLLGSLRLLALMPKARRILGYHGAEHMAIAAYEAGEPLEASRAAKQSRFHRRCGTSFLVGSALVSIAVYGAVLAVTGAFSYFALILTRIICTPFVAMISLEGQRLVSRGEGRLARLLSAPGMAAQRLTTADPEPGELEVACVALRAALADPSKEQAGAL